MLAPPEAEYFLDERGASQNWRRATHVLGDVVRILRRETQLEMYQAGLSISVEEIFPPLIIRAAHQAHDMAAGVEIEGARFAV